MSRFLSGILNYELDFPYCSETQLAIRSCHCILKDYTDGTEMVTVDGGVDSSLSYLRLYFPTAPSGLCQPAQNLWLAKAVVCSLVSTFVCTKSLGEWRGILRSTLQGTTRECEGDR